MLTYVVVAIIAYLLGSIPFGYILVRIFRKQDVRTIGSGNIGATNVARSGAKGLGIATLILDAAKGYAAAWIGAMAIAYKWVVIPGYDLNWTNLMHSYHANGHGYVIEGMAALCAILGHMYPVWLKFRGGKGVATGVGAFLEIAPIAVGIVLLIFIITVWLSRYVSLGSIIATAVFPILACLIYRHGYSANFFSFVVAFFIIYRHKDNIRRLLNGTESKFGSKKQTEARA